jgi:SAM-dependent methyltransferase
MAQTRRPQGGATFIALVSALALLGGLALAVVERRHLRSVLASVADAGPGRRRLRAPEAEFGVRPAPDSDAVAAPGLALLRDRCQIKAARRRLRRAGLDFSDSRPLDRAARKLARAIGRDPGDAPPRPDPLKSWDAWRTIEALRARLGKRDRILDMGCLGSAVPLALDRLDYRSVHGVDLNEDVLQMPRAGRIDYRVGDMTDTPWPDESFAAVTAISVIEHGVDEERMLREVARLVRPGGLFCMSTDYWPQKVDTGDMRPFGLDWKVFSAGELRELLARATERGFRVPDVDNGVLSDLGRPAIHCAGRHYTFAHAVLVRGGGQAP